MESILETGVKLTERVIEEYAKSEVEAACLSTIWQINPVLGAFTTTVHLVPTVMKLWSLREKLAEVI